jgi:DNA-damage-inducible protein J
MCAQRGIMATDSTINIRIENEIKSRAAEVLAASGLTTSAAIRIFLMRIIEDDGLPFDVRRPNPDTLKAIRAARSGKTKSAKNSKDLIKKLSAGT